MCRPYSNRSLFYEVYWLLFFLSIPFMKCPNPILSVPSLMGMYWPYSSHCSLFYEVYWPCSPISVLHSSPLKCIGPFTSPVSFSQFTLLWSVLALLQTLFSLSLLSPNSLLWSVLGHILFQKCKDPALPFWAHTLLLNVLALFSLSHEVSSLSSSFTLFYQVSWPYSLSLSSSCSVLILFTLFQLYTFVKCSGPILSLSLSLHEVSWSCLLSSSFTL